MQIWGAGLSGLIAASAFQKATIFEALPREKFIGHRALLRFRSTAVAELTGIEFRKVRVHKGVWTAGFVEPNIQLANMYSRKVVGTLGDRSIWNLDPVDRYIAPLDFIQILIDQNSSRICWGMNAQDQLGVGGPIVSTIPMGRLMEILGKKREEMPVFVHRAITVKRWQVPDADVFQTVYFPLLNTSCYRASITGETLIAEYVGEADDHDVFRPFGLKREDVLPLDEARQRYGKINEIDDRIRKRFMLEATMKHNIFSLGRFATWRNILLDDVVKDIGVVKRLMRSNAYDQLHHIGK